MQPACLLTKRSPGVHRGSVTSLNVRAYIFTTDHKGHVNSLSLTLGLTNPLNYAILLEQCLTCSCPLKNERRGSDNVGCYDQSLVSMNVLTMRHNNWLSRFQHMMQIHRHHHPSH